MVTLEGYITTFEIMPASTDDWEGLRESPYKGNVRAGDLSYGTQTIIQ